MAFGEQAAAPETMRLSPLLHPAEAERLLDEVELTDSERERYESMFREYAYGY